MNFIDNENIEIVNDSPTESEEWDRVWSSCNYATYFHSREWAEIWQSYTGGKMQPVPRTVTFSDGKSSLLPLTVRKGFKGYFHTFITSPGATFGGWLSLMDLTPTHDKLLAWYLVEKFDCLVWRINPYYNFGYIKSLQNANISKDETHAINLLVGFDEIKKNWSKGHVRACQKARRQGVTVRESNNWDDWLTYYRIYLDTIRRWNKKATSIYDIKLFEKLFLCNSPNIKLWLACLDEEIVSGVICFYSKNQVIYWHGASLEAYLPLRPVNLLFYETIRDACENGYTWFDFNPSGGHEGVKAFKRNLGAKPMPCPVVRNNKGILHLLRCFSMSKKLLTAT